jgi:hypothetical protein
VGHRPNALDDNLAFPNTAFFENTAKVVAPGSGVCADGQVVINLGEPRDKAGLVHRDLTDPLGAFILTGGGTLAPYPLDATTQSPATDNQLIRLQDGSLLALKNGYTWSSVPEPPPWFGLHELGQTKPPQPNSLTAAEIELRKNGRNAVYLFRSTDCGASWVVQSVIDAVAVENGDFAWPQPPANAGKPWSVGGFDRSELYQDPWTQTIYVSAHGDGGPFPLGGIDISNHAGVIFESNDNGVSWSTLRRSVDASAPMVMTSTPRHRLVVVREHNGEPTLCFLRPDGSWSDDFKIVAERGGVAIKLGVDGSARDIQPNTAQAVSVARINNPGDPDRLWVAYPTLNQWGKQEYELCIVDLFDGHDPTVTHLTSVHAENPANASAILGTFVQNDMVDGPGDWLNYTLFYWIEAPAKDAKGGGNQLLARYQVLMGADGVFDPGYLSVLKGQKRFFQRGSIGDYFSGGFFLAGGQHHFFAQWAEDVIKANIVSVPSFHGPDLFMYKVGDGTVDIDEIVDAPHGTVELWKKRQGWTTGWTSFVPLSMNGGRFLFMYKAGDGTVDIDQIVDPTQGTVQLWQHHGGWSKGWTNFAPFSMNGGQFMLIYKAGTGTVKVEQIVDPTQNPVTIGQDSWTKGWTHIVPFAMGGGQFLFLYKAGNGQVKVQQIVDPAQDTVTLRTDHWTQGWTSIVPIVVNGNQYLFLYKAASGEVKIHQIVDPAQDTIQVRHEHWSSGWSSFVDFVLDGRQYLFCYKAGDGSVAIVAIDDPPQGTVDIWKKVQGWTTGWTSFTLLNQV